MSWVLVAKMARSILPRTKQSMNGRLPSCTQWRFGGAIRGWLPLYLLLLASTSVEFARGTPTTSDKALVALGLEVAVVIFDEGIEAFDERDARHVLRRVEAQLLTVAVRDALTDAQRWGPVRVLPQASQLAALTLTGKVRVSDGRQLIIDVRAVDAANRVWLDQSFVAQAGVPVSAVAASEQEGPLSSASQHSGKSPDLAMSNSQLPFAALFYDIEAALAKALTEVPTKHLERLSSITQLRYGAELAPDAFADYFRVDDGGVELLRLPASDDPMLERIERIRRQEALFIDTVDEQYVDLQQQLLPTYALWLQSTREQAEYLEDYTRRAANRELRADAGSFAAMQQVYATYRSLRIQEQDLFDLATGFTNETQPTVMRTDDRVVRLSGTLDHQYQQWRQLLAQILRLERGLAP